MGYLWDIYGLNKELIWTNCGSTVDQLCSKGIGFALDLHGVVMSKPDKRALEALQYFPGEHVPVIGVRIINLNE